MILVNTEKRIRVIATQSYEDQDIAAVPLGNGMPDGMIKIIPATNELSVDDFKKVCTHPDFIKAFQRGHLFLVGKGEVIEKLPTEKKKIMVKQLKKTRATGEIKGYTYSEGAAVPFTTTALTAIFEKSLSTFPKSLKEIKDLLGYESEHHAMRIAEYTIHEPTLTRWLKAEQAIPKDDQRDGVIDMIKAIIGKIDAFDLKVAKAKGENETKE